MKTITVILAISLTIVYSCNSNNKVYNYSSTSIKINNLPEGKGKLILRRDTVTSLFAYYDENNVKVLGDYYSAYTNTINDFGIVADPGFVLIDRNGKHIFNIFPFDNSPDFTSDGYYRIIDKNNKIGYVDSLTSKIIIEPKYACAYPFENGKAKVSLKCVEIKDGEYSKWESEYWFYIDKQGNRIQ